MKNVLIACVVLAGVLPLAAQELELPPGKWWEDQRLAERIDLSAEQQQQIRAIVYDSARQMIDLKADVDRAGLDLAEVVNNDHFDPQAVRTAYAAFQTARRKLENERFEMLLAVRQVLSNNQWHALQELRRRVQQIREQRRPGEHTPGERPPGGGM